MSVTKEDLIGFFLEGRPCVYCGAIAERSLDGRQIITDCKGAGGNDACQIAREATAMSGIKPRRVSDAAETMQ